MINNISSIREFDHNDLFKFGAKVGYYGLYNLLKGYDESNTNVRIENNTANRIRYALGEYYGENYYGCKIYLVNIELNHSTMISIPNNIKKIIFVEGEEELEFPEGPILINGDHFYAKFIPDLYKKNPMDDEHFNGFLIMLLDTFMDYISYDKLHKDRKIRIDRMSSYELYLWYAPLHYLWWWVKSLDGCDISYEFWYEIICYFISISNFEFNPYINIDREKLIKAIYDSLNTITLNMTINQIVFNLQPLIKKYNEIEEEACKKQRGESIE